MVPCCLQATHNIYIYIFFLNKMRHSFNWSMQSQGSRSQILINEHTKKVVTWPTGVHFRCVRLEAALSRMITLWHQSTARAIRMHKIRLLSYRSRGTLMSYGDHSAQRCFKSNAPFVSTLRTCARHMTRILPNEKCIFHQFPYISLPTKNLSHLHWKVNKYFQKTLHNISSNVS